MTTRVRFCSSVAHLTFIYFTVTMKQLLQAPNVHIGKEQQLFSQQLKIKKFKERLQMKH